MNQKQQHLLHPYHYLPQHQYHYLPPTSIPLPPPTSISTSIAVAVPTSIPVAAPTTLSKPITSDLSTITAPVPTSIPTNIPIPVPTSVVPNPTPAPTPAQITTSPKIVPNTKPTNIPNTTTTTKYYANSNTPSSTNTNNKTPSNTNTKTPSITSTSNTPSKNQDIVNQQSEESSVMYNDSIEFLLNLEKAEKSLETMHNYMKNTGLKTMGVHIEGEFDPGHINFGRIYMIAVCFYFKQKNTFGTFIFDIPKFGRIPLNLINLFENPQILKVISYGRRALAALKLLYEVNQLAGFIDLEFYFELRNGFKLSPSNYEVIISSGTTHEIQTVLNYIRDNKSKVWIERPLGIKVVTFLERYLVLQMGCMEKCVKDENYDIISSASTFMCNHLTLNTLQHGQEVVFKETKNEKVDSFKLISIELAQATHKLRKVNFVPLSNPIINSDLDVLLGLLPKDYERELKKRSSLETLRDIVLDLGRPPCAWFNSDTSNGSDRVFLSEKEVTQENLNEILPHIGEFGGDQRAGIDGCLHRISAMTNVQGEIYGLTMRVGRSVFGLAETIKDLLVFNVKLRLEDLMGRSFLILGGPGTGKTTIIREIIRLLSENENVCVVDTSNEICGDGDVLHESVGKARRMMVPSIDDQGRVMIECLQNHTPDVIVVDEIGRKTEVFAALTVKQRGVRLVASAHGNLIGLIKNKQLNGLIGGVDSVTLGDAEARANFGRKIKAQRMATSIFDTVIELVKGDLTQWRIINNVPAAVDAILADQPYQAQLRTRDRNKLYIQNVLCPPQ
eukprot:TRINITY_DN4341_c0_g1_i2.p1 TRINITY_DN4341_c0_g1~~TRINITY_DN4341_c0_g1_i2.p1  ORF type:complete len:786 (+),score=212.45 TRINITY_DN4341_c0_g1_i2:497-2854(+)